MTIIKTKQGFTLVDCDFKIRFTTYEYSQILKDVSLYQKGVLVAIYENKEKFEDALKRC